jgi:alanyl-tRNA synthetase
MILNGRLSRRTFVGYETLESSGTVVGLIQQASTAEEATPAIRKKELKPAEAVEQFVVLDRTPFYAESGGQVGDTGWLWSSQGKFKVTDTQKTGDVIVHAGHVTEGIIVDGDELSAIVDSDRREAIRRAHSATHVLHYALQQTLGEHAQQRGSKVADDWLRFDFSNQSAVAEEHLCRIESTAVSKVQSGDEIEAKILPLEEAKQQGAMMLFGEKYPDPVRMILIGDYSKELCGGTHLDNSQEVEAFELISEEKRFCRNRDGSKR